jgi:hypothetical protein
MMTEDELENALRILRSIDRWETESFMTVTQHNLFVESPYLYFISCDHEVRMQLWEIIKERLEAGRKARGEVP